MGNPLNFGPADDLVTAAWYSWSPFLSRQRSPLVEKPALLTLDLVNTKDGSAAEVTYFITTKSLTIPRAATAVGKGMSKRHPKDRPNQEIGELLAVGRALEELGRQLVEKAERKVDRPLLEALINDDWASAERRITSALGMISNA